jgi:hypothetical protein
MNVEIGTEAAQFPENEYIWNFCCSAVYSMRIVWKARRSLGAGVTCGTGVLCVHHSSESGAYISQATSLMGRGDHR